MEKEISRQSKCREIQHHATTAAEDSKREEMERTTAVPD